MKTLGQRVEAYVGDFLSLTDSDLLVSNWLTAAARSSCSLVALTHLALDRVPLPSDGFPVVDIRLSHVLVGNWKAAMIPSDVIARASNEDSKFGGSVVSPVYFNDGGMFKSYPSANAVIYGVKLHRYIGSGDFGVYGVSPEVEELIVLDASRMAILHMMKLGAADLDGYTIQTFTAPPSIADPALTFTPATAYLAEGRLGEVLALAKQYAELTEALDTEQDIELAAAKLQEIQTRISEFRANVEAAVAELNNNAARQTDVSLRNAVEELGRQVQEYTLKLRKFEAEVSLFLAKHTGQNQLIEALSRKAEISVAEKTKRFEIINGLYLQRLQMLGGPGTQPQERT